MQLKYGTRRTWKQRRQIKSKYKELAKNINCQNIVILSELYDINGTLLNASSSIPGFIIFNSTWLLCMYNFNDVLIEKAFLQTLGHEIAHKDGDYPKRNLVKRLGRNLIPPEILLINWTTEIHHDFKGAVISGNTDIEILMEICRFKIHIKEFLGHQPTRSDSHPDWDFRIQCLQQGIFDKATIQRIAEKAGCTNTDLINELHEYYGVINLHHY